MDAIQLNDSCGEWKREQRGEGKSENSSEAEVTRSVANLAIGADKGHAGPRLMRFDDSLRESNSRERIPSTIIAVCLDALQITGI